MLTKDQKKQILDSVQLGIQKQQIARQLGIANNTITNLLATKKRCMVISDPHCDHVAGLTPPRWHYLLPVKYQAQAKEMWGWYNDKCKLLKPDIAYVMGDVTEGKGKRSGGSELITGSWKEQIGMGCEVIEATGAQTIVMVNGTPYHVGDDEDYEDILADKLRDRGHNVKIGGHEFPKVHDIQFDLKHKIGSSSIPHGRYTALAKSRLWNQLWKDIDGQPKSDIIIRGHTHYFDYCGNNNFLAMICPALSGWGSKYGVRQCEGIVNTGLLWFDIYDGTDLTNINWRFDVPKFATQKVEVYSV